MAVGARSFEPDLPEELGREYARTFDRLRWHFRGRGVSPEEAADMAQEAAVRAFLHVRRRGISGDTLIPLLHQIAKNMLVDRHRRGGPLLVSLDAAEPVCDPAQDPTEVVVRLEARRAVRAAVAALPDRHRDALLLALQGLTPAQVAERMGIGRNAADALLHRARVNLRERLKVVREGALGLVVMAYVKLRGGRRSVAAARLADPTMLGALQGPVAAAVAALVIALNMGGPMSSAVAEIPMHRARAAVGAAAQPTADAAAPNLAGLPAGDESGPVELSAEGDGGIRQGRTSARVGDPTGATGKTTVLGLDLEAWKGETGAGGLVRKGRPVSEGVCSASQLMCRNGSGGMVK